ncbi:hypothetical protein CFAEC_05255 [Corynebacterium faecale]|uniref:hypothetical protein n=1 Tax=Corynebacterium faecale TaxID=1758466 RepID=UPI0025B325DB|nr:hypothetical protein [Corynebacterium faecale]WJY91891.1 hypothetical protein CFAEC_05255 [Corynebacterium faecale]
MEKINYFGLNSDSASDGFYKALFGEYFGNQSLRDDEALNIIVSPSDDLVTVDGDHGDDTKRRTIVFGSGFKAPLDRIPTDSALDFSAVRGYLTLNRLPAVVERSATVGDPALLAVDLLGEVARGGNGLGIILDVADRNFETNSTTEKSLNALAATVIPLSSFQEIGLIETIEYIAKLDYIISDNVVGLAIADSLRIPSAWFDRGEVGSTRFEVMDYFSSVSRAMAAVVKEIPRTADALAKKTRLAAFSAVDERMSMLRNEVDRVRGLLDSKPVELLREQVRIADELRLEIPAKSGKMILELAVEDWTHFSEKQYLISFDLVSTDNRAGKVRGSVPGFFLSQNPNVGYYKYLVLSPDDKPVTMAVDFPEAIACVGLRIRKWAKNAPDMTIKQLRILR